MRLRPIGSVLELQFPLVPKDRRRVGVRPRDAMAAATCAFRLKFPRRLGRRHERERAALAPHAPPLHGSMFAVGLPDPLRHQSASATCSIVNGSPAVVPGRTFGTGPVGMVKSTRSGVGAGGASAGASVGCALTCGLVDLLTGGVNGAGASGAAREGRIFFVARSALRIASRHRARTCFSRASFGGGELRIRYASASPNARIQL